MSSEIELIYSQTGTTKRPGGMQPAGLFPDVMKLSHSSGIVIQLPCDRSQHKTRTLAQEMLDYALLSYVC